MHQQQQLTRPRVRPASRARRARYLRPRQNLHPAALAFGVAMLVTAAALIYPLLPTVHPILRPLVIGTAAGVLAWVVYSAATARVLARSVRL